MSKILVANDTQRIWAVHSDSDTLTAAELQTVATNSSGVELAIYAIPSSDSTIYNSVTLPGDYEKGKYLYNGSAFVSNSKWVDPDTVPKGQPCGMLNEDLDASETEITCKVITGIFNGVAEINKSILFGSISEDLDTSETEIDVSDSSALAINRAYKIDNEEIYVTAINSNTLTVTRGYNSTTAATHSNGANLKNIVTNSIYKYDALIQIEGSSEIMRVTSKDSSANTITVVRGVESTTAATHSNGKTIYYRK
jgi:hypothetical protein